MDICKFILVFRKLRSKIIERLQYSITSVHMLHNGNLIFKSSARESSLGEGTKEEARKKKKFKLN